MFWHLLPVVIGGQQYRLPPLSAEEWMDKQFLFDTKSEMELPHGVVLFVGWKVCEGTDSDTSTDVLCQG